jgi:hypothetical protein
MKMFVIDMRSDYLGLSYRDLFRVAVDYVHLANLKVYANDANPLASHFSPNSFTV